jgi:hypothetical protein
MKLYVLNVKMFLGENKMNYRIEPVEFVRPRSWGDVDPVTKELTGRYKGKTPGACQPDESVITEENGFTDIVVLGPGFSPAEYIRNKELNK